MKHTAFHSWEVTFGRHMVNYWSFVPFSTAMKLLVSCYILQATSTFLAKFHMEICFLNSKIYQSALGCYIVGGKSLTGCRSIFKMEHWATLRNEMKWNVFLLTNAQLCFHMMWPDHGVLPWLVFPSKCTRRSGWQPSHHFHHHSMSQGQLPKTEWFQDYTFSTISLLILYQSICSWVCFKGYLKSYKKQF